MVSKQNVRGNGGKTQVKPYEEGIKDFRVGQLSNPYKLGTKQGREWEMSWSSDGCIVIKISWSCS
jgi:hypothetical protein